jgi:hypothetical protein
MFNDILVIADPFVEPPSEVLPLRTITMIVSCNLGMIVLLHTTQEMKDFVYRFAKPRGLLDYIDYILNESEFEESIRLDTIGIYPHTIVEKYIRIENQLGILGRIKSLADK